MFLGLMETTVNRVKMTRISFITICNFLIAVLIWLIPLTVFADNHDVMDNANVLDEEAQRYIYDVNQDQMTKIKGHPQIAVITVDGTNDLDGTAQKYFDQYQFGTKGYDNGVLLLIDVHNHRMRMQTGYGIESVLPDSYVQQLMNKQVKQLFKQGDYSSGIIVMVNKLSDRIMAKQNDLRSKSVVNEHRAAQDRIAQEEKRNQNRFVTFLIVSFSSVLIAVAGIVFGLRYRMRRYKKRLNKQLNDLHVNAHLDRFSSERYFSGFMQDLNVFVLQAIIEQKHLLSLTDDELIKIFDLGIASQRWNVNLLSELFNPGKQIDVKNAYSVLLTATNQYNTSLKNAHKWLKSGSTIFDRQQVINSLNTYLADGSWSQISQEKLNSAVNHYSLNRLEPADLLPEKTQFVINANNHQPTLVNFSAGLQEHCQNAIADQLTEKNNELIETRFAKKFDCCYDSLTEQQEAQAQRLTLEEKQQILQGDGDFETLLAAGLLSSTVSEVDDDNDSFDSFDDSDGDSFSDNNSDGDNFSGDDFGGDSFSDDNFDDDDFGGGGGFSGGGGGDASW